LDELEYQYANSRDEYLILLLSRLGVDMSANDIAKEMNLRKYPDPKGRRWTPQSVLAANRRYINTDSVAVVPVAHLGPVLGPNPRPKRIRPKRIQKTKSPASAQWLNNYKKRGYDTHADTA